MAGYQIWFELSHLIKIRPQLIIILHIYSPRILNVFMLKYKTPVVALFEPASN